MCIFFCLDLEFWNFTLFVPYAESLISVDPLNSVICICYDMTDVTPMPSHVSLLCVHFISQLALKLVS